MAARLKRTKNSTPKRLNSNERTTIRKAMAPNNRPLSPAIRPFNKRGSKCPWYAADAQTFPKLSPSSA